MDSIVWNGPSGRWILLCGGIVLALALDSVSCRKYPVACGEMSHSWCVCYPLYWILPVLYIFDLVHFGQMLYHALTLCLNKGTFWRKKKDIYIQIAMGYCTLHIITDSCTELLKKKISDICMLGIMKKPYSSIRLSERVNQICWCHGIIYTLSHCIMNGYLSICILPLLQHSKVLPLAGEMNDCSLRHDAMTLTCR